MAFIFYAVIDTYHEIKDNILHMTLSFKIKCTQWAVHFCKDILCTNQNSCIFNSYFFQFIKAYTILKATYHISWVDNNFFSFWENIFWVKAICKSLLSDFSSILKFRSDCEKIYTRPVFLWHMTQMWVYSDCDLPKGRLH